jgi:hypothetical protein
VLIYYFCVHNADGSDRETVGRMALIDDNAARAFGNAMIRDMARHDHPICGLDDARCQRRAPGSQYSLPRATNPSLMASNNNAFLGKVMRCWILMRSVKVDTAQKL